MNSDNKADDYKLGGVNDKPVDDNANGDADNPGVVVVEDVVDVFIFLMLMMLMMLMILMIRDSNQPVNLSNQLL